jgi:NADH-quinone oxidoreductase subunit L
MHGDPHLDRYWFLFLYFIGSMLLLVLADNLVLTLIGWEGVGLCSYGLIGYYYRDPKERWLGGPPPTKMFPPSHAGMKAFVVTGIGDVFLLASIFIIYQYAGTFNYVELIKSSEIWLSSMAAVPGLVSIMAIFLLGGPIGKSAQFPLNEWLPEAMAGPTSVSALIHAATMVKAGVYLVARMSPIFYIGRWILEIPEAQTYFYVIAAIGAFTCFLAASQALVAVELKKILAYSTVSQIGYMMMGLGLSGFSQAAYISGLTAGIYHLVSHAFFKAALFLGAGAVIHSIENIYTFNMGGLKKKMPKTYWLMVLATLSLSGVPIFSGFWSKDAVFLSALVVGTPFALALLLVGVISAALTFAYSIRYISNTFHHEESEFVKDLEHHGHHVHDAPKGMWVPIAILVLMFCAIGVLGFVGIFNEGLSPEIFIEKQMHTTLENLFTHEISESLTIPHIDVSAKLVGVGLSAFALLLGGFLGYNFYWINKWNPKEWVKNSKLRSSIYNFLWNRWNMNDTYYKIFVEGTLTLKQIIYEGFEVKVMIPLSDFVAKVTQSLSVYLYNVLEEGVIFTGLNKNVPLLVIGVFQRVKRTQTGLLNINLIYVLILLLTIIIGMFIFGGK